MKRILLAGIAGVAMIAQSLNRCADPEQLDVLPRRPGRYPLFDAHPDQHRKREDSCKRAWTFHTGDDSGFFESTPMVIDSVMYFSARNGI